MVAIRRTFLPYLFQDTQNISLIDIRRITCSRTMVRLLRPDTLILSVPGIPVNLVVNSKLPTRSVSLALRQLNPIHKNGA